MNKRVTGGGFEHLASEFLKDNGIIILQLNYRCKIGEIDIIGMDEDTLVFFEVKYRNSDMIGSPKDAVNYHKIMKICRVSDFYRMVNRINENTSIRFDVIAITDKDIEWIKNAFEYN